MHLPPLIDLHSHSAASDGTLSPTEAARLGKRLGLAALALTDHDTIDGLAAFCQAGAEIGLETICGIEFAAVWDTAHRPEIHIVGLGFDPQHPALLAQMREIRQSRALRNEKMCRKLTAIGLPVTLEEVAANAGGEILTRAHFANVLLQKGYIHKRSDAFSRYLSPGMAGYVAREFLSPRACIETIKAAGGAAVLAHPLLYGLSDAQLEALCLELQGYGLDGMECYYSTHSAAETRALLRLAERLSLLPSGGSDFHGANKPDIRLGSGRGNLQIPYALWAALRERTALPPR